MLDELLPADQVLERAVAAADSIPEDTLEHYAFTKRALPRWFTAPDARHTHRRY